MPIDLPEPLLERVPSSSPWSSPEHKYALHRMGLTRYVILEHDIRRVSSCEARLQSIGISRVVLPLCKQFGVIKQRRDCGFYGNAGYPSAFLVADIPECKSIEHTFAVLLCAQISSFAPPSPSRCYIDIFGSNAWMPGVKRVAFCSRSLPNPWVIPSSVFNVCLVVCL